MGKILYIKGADFSANAIGSVTPSPTPTPTPTPYWASQLTDEQIAGGNRDLGATQYGYIFLNQSLYVGKKITKVKFRCNAVGTLNLLMSTKWSYNNITANDIEVIGSVETTSADVGNVVTKDVNFIVPNDGRYFGIGCHGSPNGVLYYNRSRANAEDALVPLTTDGISVSLGTQGYQDLLIDFEVTDL